MARQPGPPYWTTTKKTFAWVFGVLGISSATVIGVGKSVACQYMREVVREEQVELSRPLEKRISQLESSDSNICYDVRLTRYMIEQIVSENTKQTAINKINEPWKVK